MPAARCVRPRRRVSLGPGAHSRILSFGNASFSKPEDRPHFISLPWQINVIKKIVVSPYASASYFEWVRDEVERLSAGLGQRVVRSVMVADPD